jgi:AcrR family transcriptional regulator
MDKSKRKEKEFNYRRSVILLEAEKVFAARGFHTATMADIAGASGYAVGTLYQFFESKEKLYMSMIGEKMALLYDNMTAAAEGETDAIMKLRALILSYFQFFEDNIDFCNLFFRYDTASLSDGRIFLRNQMFEEFVRQSRYIDGILSEGVGKKLLKSMNAEDMSFAMSGMIRGMIFGWMMNERRESLTDKATLIMDTFLHGFLLAEDTK